MIIDIRTATAKQLAGYVMNARGWKQDTEPPFMYVSPDREDYESVESFSSDLNLIADAMPPGWDWSRDKYQNWIGCRPAKKRLDIYGYRAEAEVVHTGNERLDRLRLAALAWEVESKEVSK